LPALRVNHAVGVTDGLLNPLGIRADDEGEEELTLEKQV